MRAMKAARERERWPEARMRSHQEAALAALVRHAVDRSPFHRERLDRHAGERVDLRALPVLDKTTLMANLQDALCEPTLRGLPLRDHLLDPAPLLGEYRVMASSGSTGTPSLYVYSRADWSGVLAAFFRASEFIGIRPSVPRLRIAAINAPSMSSMTQRVAHTIDVGLHRVLRLSVADPLPRLVDALNRFRPAVLSAYPSIAALLADEQLAGRLRIAPRLLSTSSELRTPEVTARLERAFGVRPFDLYGTTEGLWGVDCEHHAGIHLFEDWCIVENVDADGQPVPDGHPGARVLVTNLFNRTLPLIRFEVSDLFVLERGVCACGRTLPRLQAVQGRVDDVLQMAGRDGRPVPVHPTQFSSIVSTRGVREFQIVQRGARTLVRLALAEDAAAGTADRIARTLIERLAALGVAAPDVAVELVPAIERTPAGKVRLIVPDHDAAQAGIGVPR
jgi:phenylacetate-coenzyme A ligase PaaK-like adenylate-forming protein